MKLYRVSVPGKSWTTSAKSIAHMAAFLRHSPSVRVRTISPIEWLPTHLALVGNPPDPACILDIQVATGYRLDELMKIPLRPWGMTDEQVRARYRK